MDKIKREIKTKSLVAVGNRTPEPLFGVGTSVVHSDKFWRWGDDNMMPYALSLCRVARQPTVA